MMKRRAVVNLCTTLLIFFFLILTISSCATFSSKDVYRTLSVSTESYDAAMKSLGDLYKKDMVDEETKDKAVELGRYYQAALKSAVEAMNAYSQVETDTNRDKATAALIEYSKALGKVMEYITAAIQKAQGK